MKYSIQIYGNPVLREKSRRIEHVDAGIRRMAKDMLEAMHATHGVGLAAQQVGRTEAMCVIDVPERLGSGEPRPPESEPLAAMPLVMLNPKIPHSEGQETCEEGCLSFPELFVPIKRARRITVEYMDLDEQVRRFDAFGLLGRAIQHELDHLNGKLMVDRMDPVRKLTLANTLKHLRSLGRQQADEAKS